MVPQNLLQLNTDYSELKNRHWDREEFGQEGKLSSLSSLRVI